MFQIEIKFMEHCYNHYCDFLSRSWVVDYVLIRLKLKLNSRSFVIITILMPPKEARFLNFFELRTLCYGPQAK